MPISVLRIERIISAQCRHSLKGIFCDLNRPGSGRVQCSVILWKMKMAPILLLLMSKVKVQNLYSSQLTKGHKCSMLLCRTSAQHLSFIKFSLEMLSLYPVSPQGVRKLSQVSMIYTYLICVQKFLLFKWC